MHTYPFQGFSPHPYKDFVKIELSDIEAARDKCAEIISLYGPRYLPIFERLEKEIEKKKEEQALLEKVNRIAAGARLNKEKSRIETRVRLTSLWSETTDS